MFITHRLRRSAALCALACATLVPTTSGAALAAPADPVVQERYYSSHATPDSSAALAQERYYSSHATPDLSAALAEERHYSSYGEPEPLTLPQSGVPSDDSPWLPIAISIVGALTIVAASATQLHRLRTRRRRATSATA